MGADNDIMERLASPEHCQEITFEGSRYAIIYPEDYEAVYNTLVSQAAEIVRLRGEVAPNVAGLVDSLIQLRDADWTMNNEPMPDDAQGVLNMAIEALRNPAPAMPNGVEASREQFNAWMKTRGVISSWHVQQDMWNAWTASRAADNRDAAGVCNCASGRGSEHCVVHASNDVLHRMDTHAAVPAGEAVALYQLRKADGSWIDQSRNSYDYNMANGHADDLRIVYTTPPAPMQAAPQEGEADRTFDAQDNAEYIEHCANKLDSFGQRITASALRVVASEYRALAAHPSACELGAACSWRKQDEYGDHVSTGCGHEFVLNDAGDFKDGEPVFPFCCYCAKPTVFRQWQDEPECACDNGDGPECFACSDRRARAALQHRGDSRGGEG